MEEYNKIVKFNNEVKLKLDVIYNFLVWTNIEKVVRDISVTEELNIKLECDQRPISTNELYDLKNFISLNLFKLGFSRINIKLKWVNSKENVFIQYADFVIGLARSMIYCKNNIKYKGKEYCDLYNFLHIYVYCKDGCYLNFKKFIYCNV